MAGVYVKGMKMPECCEDCRFWDGQNNGCPIVHMITLRRTYQKKPDWCPLVELPDHGDLISRQAAIDELRKCQTYRLYEGDDEPKIERSNAEAVIMHLPSEQTASQERTGRWSQVSGQATLCSCCGMASNAKQARNWRYCPHCGAEMEDME